jgi:AraC family transcriptional regulator
MASRCVPVTLGSPHFTTREVDAFQVTEAWFPPHLVLEPHVHERAVFGVMLQGSFDLRFPGRTYACPPATILTEPAGEKHGNRMEGAGARVLVVQPDPMRDELLRPVRSAVERPNAFRHSAVVELAWRVAGELRASDSAAPLAIESGVLEMLALTARRLVEFARGRDPAWLRQAREIVEDRFREGIRIGEIATEVGVHPAHLARAFRQRYHEPLGTYVRRRRLEWAAAHLVADQDPLSTIAHRAGFADQSHFTRAFKTWSGLTPGQYRRVRGLPVRSSTA